MTETNAFGPANVGDDYVTHPTSTGRARTTIVDVEIRDEEARRCPSVTRQIWMKGPNLIRGYWNKPEETAETIVDGWLATGDLGRIDGEGFLYIEDRAKDMVLRAGENVYCAEVESAVYEHPAVYEAAVFGVPTSAWARRWPASSSGGPRPNSRRGPPGLPGEHTRPLQGPEPHRLHRRPLPRNPRAILKCELRETYFTVDG